METKEGDPSPSVKLNVKFGGRSIQVNASEEWTLKDLKSHLQTLTNVLPRGQKLIFEGQVVPDNNTNSLNSLGITNGSKLMLMASQGLHQGNGPITAAATAIVNTTSTSTSRSRSEDGKIQIDDKRVERWKRTGVISFSQSGLNAIPPELWDCGCSVKYLDLSDNNIKEVPPAIGSLTGIRKLMLNGNGLTDGGVAWEGITLLKSMIYICLKRNNFTSLPSSLGCWSSLGELDVAYNRLKTLPVEIGLLNNLQLLKANNNAITSIPSSIGDCSSLYYIDLSSNLFATLPDSIGNLRNLSQLHLRRTALTALPNTLFTHCSKLSNLDLHATEITLDSLRQCPGWEEFDARRRSKLQKQLDFSVASSDKFDEGADKN